MLKIKRSIVRACMTHYFVIRKQGDSFTYAHWGRFVSRCLFKIHRSDQIRNQFDNQFEHVKFFDEGVMTDD